ncbi:MAG: STAS domain-containing protein [Ruminococcus sp.]|nr:STAS domain-containing protein [Ruminococcus sp.]
MKLTKAMNGNALTIEIEGRVDTVTSPELEKMINESSDKAESLLLDFAKVEYISSAGLRVLLAAHKAMSKKSGMKIKNAGEDIMEIFEVTGFTDILNIV